MNRNPQISGWQEGPVNRTKQHFELRYGRAQSGGWGDWIPAAVIGPPTAGIVDVEFLVNPDNEQILDETKRDILFFLIDKQEPDPWRYAQYHCGTASNVYSDVHWSFFPNNAGGTHFEP